MILYSDSKIFPCRNCPGWHSRDDFDLIEQDAVVLMPWLKSQGTGDEEHPEFWEGNLFRHIACGLIFFAEKRPAPSVHYPRLTSHHEAWQLDDNIYKNRIRECCECGARATLQLIKTRTVEYEDGSGSTDIVTRRYYCSDHREFAQHLAEGRDAAERTLLRQVERTQ